MADQNSTLTQEYLQSIFDYKEGNLYWKIKKAKNTKIGSKVGCMGNKGYYITRIDGKAFNIHRLIFAFHFGYFPPKVDHINGNRVDNRIENLRAATNSQNGYNSKLNKTNKTGIKGVSWHKASKRWRVRLRVDGDYKYFGCYKDIDYAKFISEAMRYKYHKEFSNTGV